MVIKKLGNEMAFVIFFNREKNGIYFLLWVWKKGIVKSVIIDFIMVGLCMRINRVYKGLSGFL